MDYGYQEKESTSDSWGRPWCTWIDLGSHIKKNSCVYLFNAIGWYRALRCYSLSACDNSKPPILPDSNIVLYDNLLHQRQLKAHTECISLQPRYWLPSNCIQEWTQQPKINHEFQNGYNIDGQGITTIFPIHQSRRRWVNVQAAAILSSKVLSPRELRFQPTKQ
jgi:hypothetical protein